MSDYSPSPLLLSPDRCRVLLVDVQERFEKLIPKWKSLVSRCRLLLEAAKLFDVPSACTEQYPSALGPTVRELQEFFSWPVPDKLRFSSVEAIEWNEPGDRDIAVICGIEAHVCVLQSAYDLMFAGFSVVLVTDAVASRHTDDRETAINRLRDAGATVTTTESLLFEWCGTAENSRFKQMSALVKAAEEDRG